ncbi:MAG: hypothetical protein Q8Q23_04355 [bacterium]|nr:hypothetical protein [bacterium]
MLKEKSLIILIIIVIGAIMVGLFIWFTSVSDDFLESNNKSLELETEQAAPPVSVDTKKMTDKYLVEIKAVMAQYQDFIDNQNVEKIAELKNSLLSLTVPKTYRDGHAQLVILLERIDQGLSSEQAKASFEKILAENSWLNEL